MSGKTTKLTGGAGWGLTRECPGCGRPEAACRCPAPTTLPPQKQLARVRLEKRCGKPVTVVAGLALPEVELKGLLKELKTRCGAGGTLKENELEIQGDQRETLREFLTSKGYRSKGDF